MVCILWGYVSFSASIHFDIYLGFGQKLFVRDLTKFDIYAHVNSFFHVFRQETRKKLCKWNTFWILIE